MTTGTAAAAATATATGAARIADVVSGREREFVDVLVTLLAQRSVNPAYEGGASERGAQEALARILDGWSIPSELWEPQGADLAPFASREPAARTAFAGRPNLAARLDGSGGGRSLVLNSHVDVVTGGDGWDGDPFVPRLGDGTVCGRGAVDAKGSLAAMACALAVVRELDVELAGTVILQSVVDEEAGGGGTLAFLGRGMRADAAIVGEPTGLALCPATRGSRRFRVRVPGRAAHPGEAFLGVNAAEKAMLLIAAVRARARALDVERPHPLWQALPEQHVFNLNHLEAGSPGAGAVPDSCDFEMAAGGTAAETIERLQADVEEAIAAAADADEWLRAHPPALTWGELVLRASSVAADHPFVRVCERAFEDATGRSAGVHALSAVTDMRHLVGYGGIPTLNFGPGSMRDAHTANERLDLDEYLEAIRVLAGIVVAWCGA